MPRSNCRRWSPCLSTTPRLRPSLATPCSHAERVVDHLYERVIQAFGVLFVAVLLIVLISRLLGAHLAQRAARRTSAGDKVR